MQRVNLLIFLVLFTHTIVFADTFTNTLTKEKFNGFPTLKKFGTRLVVFSENEGLIKINPAEYEIEYNSLGRKNEITEIDINQGPIFDGEINAIASEIENAANKGHQLVILHLDVKEGQRFTVEKLCSKITAITALPIIAFIDNKEPGGVFDDSICIALACDKIYIKSNAKLGTLNITNDEKNEKENQEGEEEGLDNKDLRAMFGEEVGEKFTSAYRGYVRSIAQKNNRPELLATAMVDKNIEVMEVNDGKNENIFIEPVNNKDSFQQIKTWCKKGDYLILSTDQAIYTGMADKKVEDITDVLKDYQIENVEITKFSEHQDLRIQFDDVIDKLKEICKKIEEKRKALDKASNNKQKAAIIGVIGRYYYQALKIAHEYPELGINEAYLKIQINSFKSQMRELRG